MKKIRNSEIAEKLYDNEKIASYFCYNEILNIVDECRSRKEEVKKCDIQELVKKFEYAFLEEIECKKFEISK